MCVTLEGNVTRHCAVCVDSVKSDIDRKARQTVKSLFVPGRLDLAEG